MIFKSRQVNLDPHPWAEEDGSRFLTREAYYSGNPRTYAPRPEFEPTRDPYPWVWPDSTANQNRLAIQGLDPEFEPGRSWYVNRPMRSTHHGADSVFGLNEWAPRRDEFDTPVNPILDAFRTRVFTTPREAAIFWIDWIQDDAENYKPEEVEHALRVLTRLANWSA